MQNVIACRLAAYGVHHARAWAHLPQIGIRCVELAVPPLSEWEATRRKLADHGLQATSLQGQCDIQNADVVDLMRPQLEACAYLGAGICLLSVKSEMLTSHVLRERFRAIGEAAAGFKTTVVLETHPDLVTNGDVGRRTMELIGHPRIRINFDTANVYFYNQGVTAVSELEKLLPYVAAVHLKDTTGIVGDWNYPQLGQGVVGFEAVFRILSSRGFTGPYTLELEGSKAPLRSEEAQLSHIAAAADYLRSIGVLA